ncbi:hypothetical protein OsJ_26028 [Oryza sativa Japonica Group]|uniref:Uncharacterized protein n=1 Tax=Oryza sativa subsp. japonica TaxID=39947 RepID=B9FZ20_ORYSJ|nr:hypothetical protein OsJ_26028 [Oryza sativa Japonica Group]
MAPPDLAWHWKERAEVDLGGRVTAASSGPSGGGGALEGAVAAGGDGGGGEALPAPISPHLPGQAAVKVEKEEARSR